MAWKRVEHWLLWIVGDILCIPLFFHKEYPIGVIQFMVFIVIAYLGYFEWKLKVFKVMKKLIITGPESSGKTTLFNQLTNFYNITGVMNMQENI